jgi:hypothetical protein
MPTPEGLSSQSGIPIGDEFVVVQIPGGKVVKVTTQQIADLASGGGSMSADERAYWQEKAAMLDPRAFVHVLDANFDVTVPAGERWWLFNAWHARMGDDGGDFYLRNPARPMLMPEGLNLQGTGWSNAFIYYCRPALVIGSDPRYDNDPKGLYFERLARLPGFVLNEIYAATTAGSSSQSPKTPFPSDFDYGLVVAAQAHDTAWAILANASAGLCNLMNEVSDAHQWRSAEAFMLPFDRTIFTHMQTNSTTVAGSGTSYIDGTAALMYYKLPLDW